ncbi:CMP-N-acetlyneuraminic acid synthetase [Candidatus Magnetobacterium bavaricum]|uniref:CMP-N-acetlyneuraminic acid synthetase n=1 Tax=Candidatus Magnetobacterium bavaricum TaxID=29290 RepID=A0A0F3GHC9_9BACT|nr:CMP-N-acetlyneuraminic acid synthetase [Candidatus Magnetobacterium bavaricum]
MYDIMQTCLILIPARGGSKGIPRKNMALIGDVPLLTFTIKAAIEAALPGRICLSTDDEEMRSFGLGFSIEVPFLRPQAFARDDSSMISVIKHALDWYDINYDFHPTAIMLLQPTCPFRKASSIIAAYHMFQRKDVDSLISVNVVSEHPCEYIIRTDTGFKFVMEPPDKPGRQNFPEVFFINGAIFITKVSFFKDKERLFDKNAQLYKITQNESLDIDTPMDIEYANWVYERNFKSL